MKKVLFLIHTLGAGGAEKVLINLVNNLDQSKYDITLMTVIDTGIFKQDIAKGIKYKTIFKLPHGNAKKSGEKSGSLHENYSCIKAIMKKTYTVFCVMPIVLKSISILLKKNMTMKLLFWREFVQR